MIKYLIQDEIFFNFLASIPSGAGIRIIPYHEIMLAKPRNYFDVLISELHKGFHR